MAIIMLVVAWGAWVLELQQLLGGWYIMRGPAYWHLLWAPIFSIGCWYVFYARRGG